MKRNPARPVDTVTDRLAYLDALGIPAYVPRTAPASTPVESAPSDAITKNPLPEATKTPVADPVDVHAAVVLGPGRGSCLFLAGPEADEASPLASDLSRILPAPPVWGQLAGSEGGQRLELVIAERLFTHVVVFGEAAARLVFGGSIPETCGPARVTVVDDFSRLATDPGARKSCWVAMKAAGVVLSP